MGDRHRVRLGVARRNNIDAAERRNKCLILQTPYCNIKYLSYFCSVNIKEQAGLGLGAYLIRLKWKFFLEHINT
jgi:hypothetical protein